MAVGGVLVTPRTVSVALLLVTLPLLLQTAWSSLVPLLLLTSVPSLTNDPPVRLPAPALSGRVADSPLPTLDSTRLLARVALDVAAEQRRLPTWRGGPVGD